MMPRDVSRPATGGIRTFLKRVHELRHQFRRKELVLEAAEDPGLDGLARDRLAIVADALGPPAGTAIAVTRTRHATRCAIAGDSKQNALCGLLFGRVRLRAAGAVRGAGGAALAAEPLAEPVEIEIDDRRG